MSSVDSLPALKSRELHPCDVGKLWRTQRGWRACDLSPEDWRVDIPRALARQIIERAERAPSIMDAATGWTPHASATRLRKRVEHVLEGGTGVCLLGGFSVSGDDAVDERAALLLGLLFGRPVSQTKRGNLVARVEDLGFSLQIPTVRGHQTSAELPFHCDRADRLLLVCLRTARTGGHSRVVSARALADILSEEQPGIASRLYRPLPQDRRSEEAPGEPPFSMLPIFSDTNGIFVGRYVRRFIHDSQRHPEAPRLTHEDLSAMDALDAIIERDGMALEMPLAPGDVQVLNNNVVFHARTAFEDYPDFERRRLLLRLWLTHASARPLPVSFSELYGRVEAGVFRGGVWPDGCRPSSDTHGRARCPADHAVNGSS